MKPAENHFEEDAMEYDDQILKIIPGYEEMINSLIRSIPFESSKPIKVLDLGCGTGNVTKKIKERYPQAYVTCIDLSGKMVDIARYKLAEYDDIEFHVSDVREFQYGENNYDLIISALVLHHLQTDEEKITNYQKVYCALKEGGIFLNADLVLASSRYLKNANREEWKEHMLQTLPLSEVETKWLPINDRDDHPVTIANHVDWLREVGFKEVDVVWKYVQGAILGGKKLVKN